MTACCPSRTCVPTSPPASGELRPYRLRTYDQSTAWRPLATYLQPTYVHTYVHTYDYTTIKINPRPRHASHYILTTYFCLLEDRCLLVSTYSSISASQSLTSLLRTSAYWGKNFFYNPKTVRRHLFTPNLALYNPNTRSPPQPLQLLRMLYCTRFYKPKPRPTIPPLQPRFHSSLTILLR